MSSSPPVFNFDQESASDKLTRKSKESPFMIIGLVGLAAAVGIGAYKYKHKGAMSTSVFLMQLRVAAQGTVVAALTVGIACNLYSKYISKPKPQS